MIPVHIVKQAILSICVSLAYFCIGLVRGYSAPAVPSMIIMNPELLPNKNIASWVSSIAPLAAFTGSLVCALIMQKCGRKYTVLIASPIWVSSWYIVASATSWKMLILGRVIMGFSVGLTLPSAQIYVSECSDPSIRGVLGTFPALAMSVGILFSYILGKYLTWLTMAYVNCVICMILFGAVITLPESPVWLKTKLRFEDAKKSAEWLHLSGFSTDECKNAEKVDTPADTSKDTIFSRKVFFTRPILMPFGIGIALLTIQQVSGIDAIIFFTVEIFKAAGSSLDEHLATIVVGFVQVASNVFALFIVDQFGRKPLLISSAIIMSFATMSMGTAFYLKSIGHSQFGYLPVASLIVFMVGFSIGFGCIPFLIMGEIFPTAQRSFLSSMAGSMNLLIMFIVVKTYHPLEMAITTYGTFWVYSVFCFVGVIFVIFFVPETKGRDLESIAKLFTKKIDQAANTSASTTIPPIMPGNDNVALDLTSEDLRNSPNWKNATKL